LSADKQQHTLSIRHETVAHPIRRLITFSEPIFVKCRPCRDGGISVDDTGSSCLLVITALAYLGVAPIHPLGRGIWISIFTKEMD